jgi:hypothetical protein
VHVRVVGPLLHPCAQGLLIGVAPLVRLLAAVSDMVWPQLSLRRPGFLIDVVQSLNLLWSPPPSQSQPSILRQGPLIDFNPIVELV